jgi:hypothetical protein
VSDTESDGCRGVSERDRHEEVLIEHLAKAYGRARVAALGCRRDAREPTADSFRDAIEEFYAGEEVVAVHEVPMQTGQFGDQLSVPDRGAVDGGSDQRFRQDVGVDVEDALVEPRRRGAAPVMNDVGRKDRDSSGVRAAIAMLEVVADRSHVDEQDRPGVVNVRRIAVFDEVCVEHLVNARNSWPPADRTVDRALAHARNVQDHLPKRQM